MPKLKIKQHFGLEPQFQPRKLKFDKTKILLFEAGKTPKQKFYTLCIKPEYRIERQ